MLVTSLSAAIVVVNEMLVPGGPCTKIAKIAKAAKITKITNNGAWRHTFPLRPAYWHSGWQKERQNPAPNNLNVSKPASTERFLLPSSPNTPLSVHCMRLKLGQCNVCPAPSLIGAYFVFPYFLAARYSSKVVPHRPIRGVGLVHMGCDVSTERVGLHEAIMCAITQWDKAADL